MCSSSSSSTGPVCALVKKLSLLPPYIHIGRTVHRKARTPVLCGPGSRGSRETLCMYKLPPLNSAKGNSALRNFLYFHANSLSLSFFVRLCSFSPFPSTRRYKSVGVRSPTRCSLSFSPCAPFTFRYRFTVLFLSPLSPSLWYFCSRCVKNRNIWFQSNPRRDPWKLSLVENFKLL